jgi:hypothetical protein
VTVTVQDISHRTLYLQQEETCLSRRRFMRFLVYYVTILDFQNGIESGI